MSIHQWTHQLVEMVWDCSTGTYLVLAVLIALVIAIVIFYHFGKGRVLRFYS